MDIIKIKTSKREEIVDIHKEVIKSIENQIKKKNVKDGLAIVYVPHATAAIIINENYDDRVKQDITNFLNKIIPKGKWLHDIIDNNGDAHIKASIVGPSECVIISNGKIMIGTWQSFGLAEFDGPRERKVFVEVVKSN